MRWRIAVLALRSAVALGCVHCAALAGPLGDARCHAETAEAHWLQSRAALDEAIAQHRLAVEHRDALAAELDGTLRLLAQYPVDLERIRADIARMEKDLAALGSDEQRILADLEQLRSDLKRAEEALVAVREHAAGECVGIGQWQDALAWRDRCLDRIELRRQVVRRPLMEWPTYRALFEQFTATRSEIEKLRIAGVDESQVKPVEERLDRIVRELRGHEDAALSGDPQARDARAELDRAERELSRLRASIDKQLERLPAVQHASRRVDSIGAALGQAEQALREVRRHKAEVEQSLRQARQAERFYSNEPQHLQARARNLCGQVVVAESDLEAARVRVAQLQLLECALRANRDEARTRYELELATHCPPAPPQPRLIVGRDPESHDFKERRPQPSDPARDGGSIHATTRDRSRRVDAGYATSRRDSDDPAPHAAPRSDRPSAGRGDSPPAGNASAGPGNRGTRRPPPTERG